MNKETKAMSVNKIVEVDGNVNNNVQRTQKNIDTKMAKEVNGPRGLEPTRYGDWESKGRCYDF